MPLGILLCCAATFKIIFSAFSIYRLCQRINFQVVNSLVNAIPDTAVHIYRLGKAANNESYGYKRVPLPLSE